MADLLGKSLHNPQELIQIWKSSRRRTINHSGIQWDPANFQMTLKTDQPSASYYGRKSSISLVIGVDRFDTPPTLGIALRPSTSYHRSRRPSHWTVAVTPSSCAARVIKHTFDDLVLSLMIIDHEGHEGDLGWSWVFECFCAFAKEEAAQGTTVSTKVPCCWRSTRSELCPERVTSS